MKASGKTAQKPALKKRRSFSLCARFKPPGHCEAGDDSGSAFFDFWFAANDKLRARRGRELSERKRKFREFEKAWDKSLPIMRRLLTDEISPAEAAEVMKQAVPDKALLKEIFDLWDTAQKRTPEEELKEREDMARREQELARDGHLLAVRKSITRALEKLQAALERGDAGVCEAIAEAAIQATLLLTVAMKRQPEKIKEAMRGQPHWPVFASDEPGWEREVVKQLQSLGFGMEPDVFRTRFREARGTDANLPARQWAKAAVRTIDETHFRSMAHLQVSREFGSTGAMVDFMWRNGWECADKPEWWKSAMKLKSFSKDSVAQWKPVIRIMIRQQVPEFHLLPEWKTQRNSAAARGRDTAGEIQNAILDDICSALERIAPIKEMPKSAC